MPRMKKPQFRSPLFFRIVLAACGLFAGGAVLYDRFHIIRWDGSTELAVEFRIVDGANQIAIDGARIDIYSDIAIDRDQGQQTFVLLTGADGVAARILPRANCGGTESAFGFSRTVSAHLPSWQYRVEAPGFEVEDWRELRTPETRQSIVQSGPGKMKLVIPIAIRKREE
jgi:hypothetical protein